MNNTFIENFQALCAIPHPSHHEEAISRYLYERALSKGLRAYRDDACNVIIERPAAPGYENAPLTILQAHMDMVAVARPGSDFDPLTSPVTMIREGNTLRAADSSLGADDGVGVALIQELLEDKTLSCGALRGILTTDEESGMSGAEALDPAFLEGKYLLNLDWETTGSLCCSSAGNNFYHIRFRNEWETACGVAYRLNISGLLGGHSGTAIHTGRANALCALATLLQSARAAGIPVHLASFEGGSAANAIPCSAEAAAVVPGNRTAAFENLLHNSWECFVRRFSAVEENAAFSLKKIPLPRQVLSATATVCFLSFLQEAPIGVYTMSESFPGLVESSANIGRAGISTKEVWCDILQRSSSPAVTQNMHRHYQQLADRNMAELTLTNSSPAWPLKPGSRLVELCTAAYRSLTGSEMAVEPVHAGLECSAWAQKAPHLDMISIGPDVRDIHSPEETLDLESVTLLDRLVRQLLAEIGKE